MSNNNSFSYRSIPLPDLIDTIEVTEDEDRKIVRSLRNKNMEARGAAIGECLSKVLHTIEAVAQCFPENERNLLIRGMGIMLERLRDQHVDAVHDAAVMAYRAARSEEA